MINQSINLLHNGERKNKHSDIKSCFIENAGLTKHSTSE